MVGRAAELLRQVQAFHRRQRATHRRVYRVGSTRFFVTAGQTATTAATAWGGMSLATAGLPSWAFFGMLLGGFFGGKYLFPVPDSSVASGTGPHELRWLSPEELDGMSPQEIRAYEDNITLVHPMQEPSGLGTRAALQRHRDVVLAVVRDSGADPAALAGMSLEGLYLYRASAARHESLRKRWLAYELDPQLVIDYPAMTDVSFPPTAAMIKAMKAAEEARKGTTPADYAVAVETFSLALAAAEAAAGVPSP